MSEQSFAIKFEVYNAAWVDITSDVKSNPRPRWNRGIMSNRPQDRVGFPGILTFTLNNAAGAHLAGYYSPGHANCWSGWTTGLKVRLSLTFEGITYYKYYGRIQPDGIDVEPGMYGARTVGVTCGDGMYLAGQHEVKTLTYALNQKIGDVVTAVDNNMPFTALAYSIATGVETFPTIFDIATQRTTTMAEYYKAALSEWAYIYDRGDKTGGETRVVENQVTRTLATAVPVLSIPAAECGFLLKESDGSYLLKESDGDKLILNQTQAAVFAGTMSDGMLVSYGKTMANRVNSSAYPRRVDAAATTVLWKLEKSFKINIGETITGYRGQYRDPNNLATKVSGISMAAMVSGTDYVASANEDGTGANLTSDLTVTPDFGTESVLFTLSAASTLWVQTLQVKGKGVYIDTAIQSMTEDNASQLVHGVIPLSLDFKYQADARKVQTFCAYIISKEAWPRLAVDACPIWANTNGLNAMAFLELEPGNKLTISEAQTGVNADYFIMGYSAEIYNGRHVLWTPVLKDDPGFFAFWQLGVSALGVSTVLG